MRRAGLLLLLALLVLSCRPSLRGDARALSQRGVETGTRLAGLYDSLAGDTVDAWELTAFRRGFMRLPAPEADARASFEAQYKALRARARLARRMVTIYESLGRLASYDTADEIGAAISGLEADLEGVVESPLQEAPRRDVLDAIIKGIASWKETRELRSGARLIEQTAVAVDALFRGERELYRDIAADRADKYRQIATELVQAKEVVSSSMVDRVLSAYGLAWPDVKAPFQDERAIAGILEIIDARSRTFEAQSEDETTAVSRALSALLREHREIRGGD
ncbi:MAG TPA: hypothetical protein VMS98_09520 [Thermoanaerobaculia bacterium]|nr:hypothetical protein [Thermoanaerobaculia bacterium]